MNPTMTIIDVSSGIIVDREMTDEEYAQYLIDQQNITQLPFTQVEPDAD